MYVEVKLSQAVIAKCKIMSPIPKQETYIQQHNLNQRQALVLRHLSVQSELSIQDYQALVPDASRRTLQRDLKDMIDKKIIMVTGATNQAAYRLLVKI